MTDPDARTYFHSCEAGAELGVLLDPARQFTEPWGEHEHGPCDKCGGSGTAPHECRSCLETGALPDCPACEGRVRFEDTCPACEGSGEITHTRRRGIAVSPTREGLYRYLAERGGESADRVLVELRGRLSDERDLDADCGALLLLPEQIVAVQPLDGELIEALRGRS